MDAKPKRPPSVWIAQILLLIYLLILVISLASLLAIPKAKTGGMRLVGMAIFLAMLSVLTAAFLGLVFRKSWGRWLAVGLFSVAMLWTAISQFTRETGGGSAAYSSGYILGSLLVMSLFGYLIYRLAMGDAASDFFNYEKPGLRSQLQPPPPPAAFDP
jgi:hypothetical protein